MDTSFLDDFKNAWNKPNNALAQIIIINAVIFIVMAVLNVFSTLLGATGLFDIIYNQFSIPPRFDEFIFRPWTIITYAFAHDLSGIMHILFNMLVLYWFGKLIAEYIGNNKVIAIYILGALAGAVTYLFVYNAIPFYVERSEFHGMVGASAAVYAMTVAAATLMPNYSFQLLFFGSVRIKYIALFYIIISFMGSVGGNAGGNIAHLGGAFIGYIYIKQLQSGNDIGKWVIGVMNFFKSFFTKQSNIKVTHKSKRASTSRGKSSKTATQSEQAEIDSILDKISQSGYESLSSEEKQKLFNASKK